MNIIAPFSRSRDGQFRDTLPVAGARAYDLGFSGRVTGLAYVSVVARGHPRLAHGLDAKDGCDRRRGVVSAKRSTIDVILKIANIKRGRVFGGLG